jgi:hypothetical protein
MTRSCASPSRLLPAILAGLFCACLWPCAAWAADAAPPARAAETRFTARDQSFSLLVPAGWERSEVDDAGGLKVEFTAPDAKFLEYVVLRVLHVSAPHKSVERALDDLRNPQWPGNKDATFTTVRLAGREAQQRERRGLRSLPSITPEVPNLERILVLPNGDDFFVLTADLPQEQEPRLGPAIARMLESFRPAPAKAARPAEVTAEEYAVYAAFLNSGGVVQAGEVAPYLRETSRERVVAARTVAGPELAPDLVKAFADCGGVSKSLAAGYAARRNERALVTDRLPVAKLRLRAEAGSASAGPGLAERISPRPGRHMPEPTLEFSRAGFDAEGRSALFYVTNFGTSPGTSHLLLMEKRDGAWRLRCAVMLDMRIY